MKRIALLAGSYVLVAIIAFTVGSKVGFRQRVEVGQAMEKVGSMVTAAWASQRAALLFHEADYAQAREALVSQVAVLEELASRPDLGGVSMAHSDLAMAYMRLAILEDRKGNPAKSADFSTKAEANARQAGWRDPSASCIRWLVERAEKDASRNSKPGA